MIEKTDDAEQGVELTIEIGDDEPEKGIKFRVCTFPGCGYFEHFEHDDKRILQHFHVVFVNRSTRQSELNSVRYVHTPFGSIRLT